MQRLTYPHPIDLSEFICETGSLSARLVFETRAKCQDFVARFKNDGVSHMMLTAPFATLVPLYLFAEPNYQRTEKSGDILHHFGKFWHQSYKTFSPTRMPKVTSLFQPLMYEHKSLAFTIAETGLENQCSSLPHSDKNNCSMSLLLICVNLKFLKRCYNKL